MKTFLRRCTPLIVLIALLLTLTLPGAAMAQGDAGQERPTLSGTPQVIDTPHFRVFYTTAGVDGVPFTDSDGSGAPDYAEFVARTMEEVWRVEVEELGWNPPPPDEGEGGDARYDVYLQNIYGTSTDGGDIAGYTDNFGSMVGDNANTPAAEARSSYSYLVLDHDYEGGAGLGVGLTVEDYIRVTAAHEFNHAIQSGYDGEEPYNWLWEATASWMESEVFPQVVDNLSYLSAVFKSPDTCLVGQGGDRAENNLHWYGMWVFLQSIDQAYGHEAVRALWEQAITLDGYAAVDAALALQGDTLDGAVLRYAVRNLLHDYERAHSYPVLRLEGTILAPGTWTPPDGVQSFGTDYVELALLESAPVRIAVEGEQIDARVIGIAGGRAEEVPLGEGAVVAPNRYEHAYLLITSLAREANTASCQTYPYTVTVTQTELFPAEPEAAYDAANFLPPQVEALADPDSGQAPAADPAVLDVPFTVLVPGAVPAGYTLNAASALPAAAFDLPEGSAAVLEYGAPDGTFVTVMQGASPWPSLDAYLAEHEPRAGEAPANYKGVPALALLAPEAGGWSSVLFVLDGLFVVVEGNAPAGTVEAVAVNLLP